MNDYNPALEDYIRIPLQLRFERDDMFETLIAPARADRSLTTLIHQLLQAYYSNQTVRDIVVQQSMGFTDIDVLAKQVERVSKAHNNARILTGVVMDDVLDARDGIAQNTAANNAGDTNTNTAANADILALLQNISTQVGGLTARMDKLESTAGTSTLNVVHATTSDTTHTSNSRPLTQTPTPVQAVTPTVVSTPMRTQPVNKFSQLAESMAKFG